MITGYCLVKGQIEITDLGVSDVLPSNTLWLDVAKPRSYERAWLGQYYKAVLPDRNALNELASTSRFYQNDDGIHIHSFFPHRQGKEVRLTSVFFNLRSHLLITLRDENVGLFRLFRHHLKHYGVQINSSMEIFAELFAAKIDCLADMLEEMYAVLEELSYRTLRGNTTVSERDHLLRTITIQEDINDKIRLCLLDTQRSIRYLARNRSIQLSSARYDNMMDMLRDIESLLPHTQFLFGKINFLLDAMMGFMSHEQNKVNKIFSWVATLFLPPTLIGSIYGMNFKDMPELQWVYGYEFALTLMVISALVPYVYFKYKRWL